MFYLYTPVGTAITNTVLLAAADLYHSCHVTADAATTVHWCQQCVDPTHIAVLGDL